MNNNMNTNVNTKLDAETDVNMNAETIIETNNKESVNEQKKRFALIWSTSRKDVGKTQEYMAEGLGVSKKTVQNWENGTTAPDFFTGSNWFRVLGINPFPYYLAFLFPDMFDGISPENDDAEINQALMALVTNSTSVEKRELLYLMAGHHGSSWYSLLQMFTAHCHTSMQSRVNVARSILDNYEMEAASGKIVCPANIAPDIQVLKNAVVEGKKAVMLGKTGYTNFDSCHQADDLSEACQTK